MNDALEQQEMDKAIGKIIDAYLFLPEYYQTVCLGRLINTNNSNKAREE